MNLPVVPYFEPSVTDVVGPFMDAAGLERSGVDAVDAVDAVGATWDDGRTVVKLSYYPEDAPNYTVNVSVAGKADDGTLRWVGLWKAIPDSAPARAYTTWSFHNEAELRSLLLKLVSDVLTPHGPSLWADRSRLATLTAEQDAETQLRFMADELEAQLAQARWSFDNDRFAEARDRFVLVGEDRLSAADRRRLHVSRAKAAAEGRA